MRTPIDIAFRLQPQNRFSLYLNVQKEKCRKWKLKRKGLTVRIDDWYGGLGFLYPSKCSIPPCLSLSHTHAHTLSVSTYLSIFFLFLLSLHSTFHLHLPSLLLHPCPAFVLFMFSAWRLSISCLSCLPLHQLTFPREYKDSQQARCNKNIPSSIATTTVTIETLPARRLLLKDPAE